MGKFTTIQPIDQYSGKLLTPGKKGIVAMPAKGGAQYARNYVRPANPQTSNQMAVRTVMTVSAQAYSSLSQSTAQNWINAASQITLLNSFGQPYKPSGIDLFTRINSWSNLQSNTVVTTVPTPSTPGTITGLTSITSALGSVTAVVTHTLASGERFFIRYTRPLPSAVRKARFTDLTMLAGASDDNFFVSSGPGSANLVISSPQFPIAPGDFVGFFVQTLAANYWPGSVFFVKNTTVV